jgi:hypothetical protein
MAKRASCTPELGRVLLVQGESELGGGEDARFVANAGVRLCVCGGWARGVRQETP